MTRKDVRQFYEDRTASLSTITRQLALAGIGVLWVLKTGDVTKTVKFVPVLNYAFGLYVLGLGFDLLQYAYASLAWGIFNGLKEKQQTPKDEEFQAPRAINWPTLFLFWGKVILTTGGYLILLVVLGSQIWRD